ncbi:(d)CMP kinase [Patescibacteria group bacterium]|nr:(d)CMP kinase [Patescibacteria group bacterium]
MTECLSISLRGLSASGKGTIASLLAKELNIQHVDCGQIFRAIALYVHEHRVKGIASFFKKAKIQITNRDITVEGKTYFREQLQTENVGRLATELSRKHSDKLVSLINALLSTIPRVIVDGRNAGIDILPNPNFSFFLQTKLESRVQRRYNQERSNGIKVSVIDILHSLSHRDEVDKERDIRLVEPQRHERTVVTDGKTPLQCVNEIITTINKTKSQIFLWVAVDKQGKFFTYEDGAVIVATKKSKIPIRVRECKDFSIIQVILKPV